MTPTADGGAIAVGLTSTDLFVDGYVVKTDADGTLLWERTLTLSPLPEIFFSALPTPSGGAVVAGAADDPSSPNYRPWLLELDADGNTLWSSEDSYTVDLPVDSGIVRAARLLDGRIAVAGGANSFTNPEDPWVLIVDSDGVQQSFAQYETLGEPGFGVATYVNNLAPTADGGFVATGYVSGGLGFAFLWKFDAAGQPEWDRLYQAEFFRESYSVRQLASGDYLLTGCDLPNCNDLVVARVDALVEPEWIEIFADPFGRYGFGRDVAERASGDLVAVQTLVGAIAGLQLDTELLELSADGSLLAVTPLEVGTVTTAGYRLELTPTGDLWAAGYANDTTDPQAIDGFVALLEEGQTTLDLLLPQPVVAGEKNRFSALSASPGATVTLYIGRPDGSSALPGCLGVTLEMAGARPLATAEADAAGTVRWTAQLPAGLAGKQAVFQAAEGVSCVTSTAAGTVIQ